MLSRDYLIKGITGLSRAAQGDANTGHFGAALIAIYFFCRDNAVEEETSFAIAREADKLVARHPALFKPFPSGLGDPKLLETIPNALETNIDRLVAIGHNVIFAALALKALREQPEMITPPVTQGICDVIAWTSGHPVHKIMDFDVSGATIAGDDTLPVYTSRQVIAAFAAREFLNFQRIYYGAHRGFVGHLVTHGHALIELDRLGYPELARRGHDAHRLHAKRLRVLDDYDAGGEGLVSPVKESPLTPAYWQGKIPSANGVCSLDRCAKTRSRVSPVCGKERGGHLSKPCSWRFFMMTSIQGVYRDGKVDLLEPPANVGDGTQIIVTFVGTLTSDGGTVVDLPSRGMDTRQAADLRGRLATFAADWNEPTLDVYDDYDAAKASL